MEQDFRAAAELAQCIGAKSLQLRASTSLARLLLNKGCSEKAREVLTNIYQWFTEGFDTPDLIEAKLLLDTLSA